MLEEVCWRAGREASQRLFLLASEQRDREVVALAEGDNKGKVPRWLTTRLGVMYSGKQLESETAKYKRYRLSERTIYGGIEGTEEFGEKLYLKERRNFAYPKPDTCNLFTNWMGDDSFLWKMSGDLRVFNQMGDITTFEGEVTKKYIEDDKCCVDIEAWAKNQRDEWSMPPHTSIVILPSKEHGPVVYPDPLPELVEEIKRARPLDDLIKEGLI